MTERPSFDHMPRARSPLEPVAGYLAEVEELIRRRLQAQDPFLEPAARHTAGAGGKRLRPGALLLMLRLVGERPGLPHVVVCAVLELCHTASLLHDDVLDHARRRRGRASLNRLRGNRETILFGDHILAGAFELLADLARPELVAIMARLVREVCAGEIRQWAGRSFDLTEAAYLAVVRAKTASFFRYAGTLAGRMGCLGREQTARLEAWGDSFGIAYQIADDVYDIVSPPRADKSTGRDARSGVLTLPWILLRDAHGMPALRERYLASTSGTPALPEDRPLRDALGKAVRIAEGFLDRGARALETFPDSEARSSLSEFGRQLSEKLGRLVHAG